MSVDFQFPNLGPISTYVATLSLGSIPLLFPATSASTTRAKNVREVVFGVEMCS
jgi:hypothetical protein